jgi:predicted transcriptional regulator
LEFDGFRRAREPVDGGASGLLLLGSLRVARDLIECRVSVMDAISLAEQPASASRLAAALRSPCVTQRSVESLLRSGVVERELRSEPCH